MRFFDLFGRLQRATRAKSVRKGVSERFVDDPNRLSELLSDLEARVAQLEAKELPEAVEFEVDVGTAGAPVQLNHNLDCPVRFFVTSWKSSTNNPPSLLLDTSSTTFMLVLRSYVAGRAIIRIEPSQFTVS